LALRAVEDGAVGEHAGVGDEDAVALDGAVARALLEHDVLHPAREGLYAVAGGVGREEGVGGGPGRLELGEVLLRLGVGEGVAAELAQLHLLRDRLRLGLREAALAVLVALAEAGDVEAEVGRERGVEAGLVRELDALLVAEGGGGRRGRVGIEPGAEAAEEGVHVERGVLLADLLADLVGGEVEGLLDRRPLAEVLDVGGFGHTLLAAAGGQAERGGEEEGEGAGDHGGGGEAGTARTERDKVAGAYPPGVWGFGEFADRAIRRAGARTSVRQPSPDHPFPLRSLPRSPAAAPCPSNARSSSPPRCPTPTGRSTSATSLAPVIGIFEPCLSLPLRMIEKNFDTTFVARLALREKQI